MMKVVSKSINNKDGSGMILSCILVLVLMILFLGISEQARNFMTARSARDGLESISTTIATNNFDEVYRSQREGYFSAYTLNTIDNWEEEIENSNLDNYLENILGVKKQGNVFIKEVKDGNVDFTLSNVKVNINNPNLAPSDTEKNKDEFSVEITADLEIYPMFSIFGNKEVIKVSIGAESGYIPKF